MEKLPEGKGRNRADATRAYGSHQRRTDGPRSGPAHRRLHCNQRPGAGAVDPRRGAFMRRTVAAAAIAKRYADRMAIHTDVSDDLRLFQTGQHACGYWPERQARDLVLDPHDPRLGALYPLALSWGFRRSGD